VKHFETCFAAWIVNNPLKIIALCILLILVPSTGLPKLYFDTSYRVFFGEDNPQLAEFEAIEAIYTENYNAMIVVAPSNEDVFTASTLAAIEELTGAAWQVPHSRRVDSITNFQYTYAEKTISSSRTWRKTHRPTPRTNSLR
jgi:predicted RND superfamily exporter protein